MDFSSFQLREEGLIQHFENELTSQNDVKVKVARLDWIHNKFGGNKWFKLQSHLKLFSANKHTSIISFGGPYSNHLYSLAAICNELQIPCIGIIRSAVAINNPTIEALRAMNMNIIFLSKNKFDTFNEGHRTEFIKTYNFEKEIGENPFWIDLGGEGVLGIEGASLIWPFLMKKHSQDLNLIRKVYVPIGTGTTFLGLKKSIPNAINCIGITAFKGGDKYISENKLLSTFKNDILVQYAGSGFGKSTASDLAFYELLKNQHELDVDIVYTGKAFKAMLTEISLGKVDKYTEVLFVHTGGQQGNPKAL